MNPAPPSEKDRGEEQECRREERLSALLRNVAAHRTPAAQHEAEDGKTTDTDDTGSTETDSERPCRSESTHTAESGTSAGEETGETREEDLLSLHINPKTAAVLRSSLESLHNRQAGTADVLPEGGSPAALPRSIFTLTKDQALQAFEISSVLEEWECFRFRRGYITWWMMLWTRLVGVVPLFGLSYAMHFLANMAQTRTSALPIFTMRGPGNMLMEALWYLALYGLPLSFLYAVVTGFLFRKKDHVKYKFFTYLFILFISVLVFSELFAFALMITPDVFPGSQWVFSGIVLFATWHNLREKFRAYRAELIRVKNPRSELNRKMNILFAVNAFLWPLLLIFNYGKLRTLKEHFYGVLTLTLPLTVPFFLPFVLWFDTVFFLPYFYLRKYPEDFRRRANKSKSEWYGRVSAQAKEEWREKDVQDES